MCSYSKIETKYKSITRLFVQEATEVCRSDSEKTSIYLTNIKIMVTFTFVK